MTYIQSIDPGTVNLGIATFYVKDKIFKLVEIQNAKIDAIRDIIKYIHPLTSHIIIESQPIQSRLRAMVSFLEGWCYGTNRKFNRVKTLKGLTYKDRKRGSENSLNEKDINLYYKVVDIFKPKFDDIADCFNLGYNFLTNKSHKYTYSTECNCIILNYKNDRGVELIRKKRISRY